MSTRRWSVVRREGVPSGGLMELEVAHCFDVCDAKLDGRAVLTFKGSHEAEYTSGRWVSSGEAGVSSVELQRGRRAIAHRFRGPPLTFRLPDGKRLLTEADQDRLLSAFKPWAKANISYWTGEDYSSERSVPREQQDKTLEEARVAWLSVARALCTLDIRTLRPSMLALPVRRVFLRLPWYRALLWFWLSHDGHRHGSGEERAPLAMTGGRLQKLRRNFPS